MLNTLRQKAPISRASLAEMTGLNKATISRLVRDLIENGFVRERGIQSSLTGRPSILLEMDPHAGYIIGARVDVDCTTVILTNFSAEVLWRTEEGHDAHDPEGQILGNLLEMVRQAAQAVPPNGHRILGLGLSMPGLVDVSDGTLLFAPNLGWSNVPVKEWLASRLEFPVYVDNEANMAALGESYFGAARNFEEVLYINITAGIGAGIVLNQRIMTGASGLAGEVGHMTINPEGPRCNCGNRGCWEMYAGTPAVFRRMREMIAAGETSSAAEIVQGAFNRQAVPEVVCAAIQGDKVARRALEETGKYIGIGVASLINTFNPRLVVLGGYLSPAYPLMLAQIKTVVRERALKWLSDKAEIVIASYGSDASLMGAIATIYDHVLSFPMETIAQGGNAHMERR